MMMGTNGLRGRARASNGNNSMRRYEGSQSLGGGEVGEGEQQQLRRRHRQLLSSSFLGSGESEAEAPEEGSAINPRD